MSSAMQTVCQHSTTQSPSQYASTGSPRQPLREPSVGPRQSSRHQTDHAGALNPPASPDQFYSPPSAVTSTMNSPQHLPLPPSTRGSPITPTPGQASSSTRPRPTPTLSDGPGSPPIPPPRTSSNQRSRTSSTAPSANTSTERVANSKHSRRRGDGARDRGDRDHAQTNGRDKANDDAESSAVKRRKCPHSPDVPQRAASTREPRDHTSPSAMESRSEATMGPTSIPTGADKEPSTVVNRMVITDPAVDNAREKERQAEAQPDPETLSGLGLVSSEGVDDGGRGARSRHDYSNSSSRRKETTFGDYVLGQTIGEGEFGKVKLGWKKDGSVQVAIKLLRRESLGNNPSRLPKIYREISILKELSHPNIVRLHEMAETDRHIGIVLEYASGGELFDYILNHRYLKDNPARRLFAQLVSGVGYLHKKGIVHRDLKLENLMLDRNRNIIITDFGFANTFDPTDELGEEIEYNLTNREFVKRMKLDRPNAKGLRRGDLMQTSCGSPCYAAPELVVTDSLYTGRKVDVWSCGVILYAMLAGYLPFDDDPANPEGDNINLLYKYIVTTPLTFPEYVTPHARDLLRRILVPDPRKRADLFEVARHSWLAEYAHVVSHITSNTTNVADIANTTVPAEDQQETPSLARSASVREPPKTQHHSNASPVGGLSHHTGKISQEDEKPKARDAKRRTVQVEYVPPQSQTARGDSTTASSPLSPISGPAGSSQVQPKFNNQEPPTSSTEGAAAATTTAASRSKPLPKDPPVNTHSTSHNTTDRLQGRPHSQYGNLAQSISDLTGTLPQTTRPRTGGSLASTGAGRYDSRLPSRGSYSQPAAPAVATTNVQGRLAQPKNATAYSISPPTTQQPAESSIDQPSTNLDYSVAQQQEAQTKSHKRSSTVSSIGEKLFGRSGSIFGGRSSQHGQRPNKRYPPTSMKEPIVSDEPRASMDSRRSISHPFHRKLVDSSQEHTTKQRRFSLLPASFSMKNFSSSKETPPAADSHMAQVNDFLHPPMSQGHQQQPQQVSTSNATSHSHHPTAGHHTQVEQGLTNANDQLDMMNYSAQIDQQFATLHAESDPQHQRNPYGSPHIAAEQYYQEEPHANSSSARYLTEPQNSGYTEQFMPSYPEGYNPGHNNDNGSRQSIQPNHQSGRVSNVLQKNNRKFADAYEYEKDPSHHSGSSGAARRVMDFFRRRGKYRAGDHQ
ncbi:protein kinase [Histoplasma capsulatum G186AR]|uniref:non-specific serine/threonine protein kinase n=1 Tax=Ajellomyces capsulatus (strain G186AR / H82 / ATCC MYA-2454 / RMSCC 2432) TaxID=447093 RepID=C0NF06_AJECG|nr:protein kinase [Histoplasma capsulatum G186AR]EEH09827.1 protein kinase [Histoplasma capsulatum G186AR]